MARSNPARRHGASSDRGDEAWSPPDDNRAEVRPLDPRLLRRARPARTLLAVEAGLGALSALLLLAQAVVLAKVVTRSFGGANLNDVLPALGLLFGLVVVRSAATWGFEVMGRRAAADVLSELRMSLVEQRLRRRPAALDGVESSEVAATAVQGVDAPGGVLRQLPARRPDPRARRADRAPGHRDGAPAHGGRLRRR
jgi:hypothetical protein